MQRESLSICSPLSDTSLERNNFQFNRKLKEFLWKYYFLIGAILILILAKVECSTFKSGGILKTEYSFNLFGCVLIFLLIGLKMTSQSLQSAIYCFKVNMFIEIGIFLFMPSLFTITSLLLKSIIDFNKQLIDGIIILGCLPTTINMSIVLTASSSGNLEVALFNAAFSNIIGVFISPLLISSLLSLQNMTNDISYIDIFTSLILRVAIPLIIGHSLRYFDRISSFMDNEMKPYSSKLQETMLLLIILTGFADYFCDNNAVLEWTDFIIISIVIIIIQVLSYIFVWKISSLNVLQFTLTERISILYCIVHKTLTFGLPLITIMFPYDESGLYAIPLLLYHFLAIIIGTILSPIFQRKVLTEENGGGSMLSTGSTGSSGIARLAFIRTDLEDDKNNDDKDDKNNDDYDDYDDNDEIIDITSRRSTNNSINLDKIRCYSNNNFKTTTHLNNSDSRHWHASIGDHHCNASSNSTMIGDVISGSISSGGGALLVSYQTGTIYEYV